MRGTGQVRINRAAVVLALTMALGGSTAAAVETADPAPLSLREAITRALSRNFTLRISLQDFAADQGRLDSANAAYVPKISAGAQLEHVEESTDTSIASTLEARHDTASYSAGVSGLLPTGASYSIAANVADTSGRRLQSSDTSVLAPYNTAQGTFSVIEISQPLLRNRLIDSARLSITQQRLALRAAELEATATAQTVVHAVERAYYDLIATHETIGVRQAAVDLAQRTLEDTRRRIAIGSLADLDEMDAQSQVATASANLLTARQALREAENTLLVLTDDSFTEARRRGVSPTDNLVASEVFVGFESSAELATQRRPEIQLARLAVDQADSGLNYEKNQRLPSISLVGALAFSGSGSSADDVASQWSEARYPQYGAGVTVSIPWSDRSARGKVRSAAAERDRALLAAEQTTQGILSEVDSAIEGVRSSFERIAATRAAREFAEAALAAEERRFASGNSTSFTVLQKQRDVTAARGDEITALADYNKALADLHLREGTTLEAWQIQFRVTTSGTATAL